MRALKRGESTKRGGTNDIKKEKSEVDDELKELEKENELEKRIIDENQKRYGKF